VITAYVQGREAEHYRFTSGLPVSLLKLLAPTLMPQLDKPQQPALGTAARQENSQSRGEIKPVDYSQTPRATAAAAR
jgi:hypothetical protein